MPTCLGLYVEQNVIKYAKVSKERDNIKVEAFGVKFYENIAKTIEQIVSETYSYKTPISVNLSEEMYNYFFLFNMLNKNDLQKAVATEFESHCYDSGINEKAYETRYAVTNSKEDKEKLKVIHVSANKTDINKRIQQLEGNRLSCICPTAISISNLLELRGKQNAVIVNMEETTTITTIIEDSVYDITRLETGAGEILRNINAKENSYSKAYEICKNTTIYTTEGKELVEDTNEYLEDIMPTLYNIVSEVQKSLNLSVAKIENVYITGTACVINNIDLYFQEYFPDIKCEILKPYFIKPTIGGINIKDYIEVNSAIAIAMQGLGYGIKNMNFKKAGITDNLFNIDIGKKGGNKESKFDFSFDLSGKLDATEKYLLRTCRRTLINYTHLCSFFRSFDKADD